MMTLLKESSRVISLDGNFCEITYKESDWSDFNDPSNQMLPFIFCSKMDSQCKFAKDAE